MTMTAALPNLDRIIRGLLYVLIVSLPFSGLLFLQRNGFIILMVLLALWCAVNRRHFFLRTPIDLPLIAFVAWIALTIPFAASLAYSFKEFAKLLQQGLFFYVVLYFFQETVHRRRLVWTLLGTLAGISAYGIWQFAVKLVTGIYPAVPELGSRYLIESVTSGEVWLTTYLVLLLPLSAAVALYAATRRERLAAGGTAGLAVLCQVLTLSRAGLVAILAEAATFAWVLRRKSVTYVTVALAVGLLAGIAGVVLTKKLAPESLPYIAPAKFTAYNLEARFNVWSFGLSKLIEHPIVGIGYGKDNFYAVTGEQSRSMSASATTEVPAGTHNTFLDIAIGAGLPAVGAFLWLLGTIVAAGITQFRRAEGRLDQSLAVALIAMVVGMGVRNFLDHMWIGALAMQFWALVALAIRPLSTSVSLVAPLMPLAAPSGLLSASMRRPE